jgi:molybdopterin-guanine dinucleotide biosynthesis protein A
VEGIDAGPETVDVTGFVTAGGLSSRMGRDKAWLDLGGSPMIRLVIQALAPVTSGVKIIANSEEYKRLGLPVFADKNTGIGPLEAIRNALEHSPTGRILLVACDMPFVTTELFALLLKKAGDFKAVVPAGPGGKLEPLCAAYHADALPEVERLIELGRFKVSHLFDLVSTRYVPFDEIDDLPGSKLFFMNVNTVEDFERARRLSGLREAQITRL